MTTLQAATSYKGVDGRVVWWQLDDQDRVLGATSYFVRNSIVLVAASATSIFPKMVIMPTFSDYLVRWPASTAPTVAGAKFGTKAINVPTAYPSVYPASLSPVGASPSGDAVYMVSTTNTAINVTDVYGTKLFGAPPYSEVYGVNDAGIHFGSLRSSVTSDAKPALWAKGKPVQTLAIPGFTIGVLRALNKAGTAAGAVSGSASDGAKQTYHAARWVNGNLEVLDGTPGLLTQAVSLSSNGHVVIQTMGDSSGVIAGSAISAISHRLLLNNGQTMPLDCGAGRGIRYNSTPAVNASGLVGATCVDILGHPSDETNRAAIWRDGVMSDLTAYIAGKGVALPAGAVLTRFLALNDKGSIVAEMKDAAGKFSYVRFTAIP